jgi:hypothetical protein
MVGALTVNAASYSYDVYINEEWFLSAEYREYHDRSDYIEDKIINFICDTYDALRHPVRNRRRDEGW